MTLRWLHARLEFPAKEAPQWASSVERWYQLDAAALTLTETYWQYRSQLNTRPEWIFLASPLASNLTDAQFAANPTPSPAKFVHNFAQYTRSFRVASDELVRQGPLFTK